MHDRSRVSKTYFYKKPDGTIFACEEKEAAVLQKKKWEQVGVSDGKLYFQLINKAVIEQKVELDALDIKYPKEAKPNTYYTKRAEILEKTRLKFMEAATAEQKLATGNKEKPQSNDVTLVGNFTPQMRASFLSLKK